MSDTFFVDFYLSVKIQYLYLSRCYQNGQKCMKLVKRMEYLITAL